MTVAELWMPKADLALVAPELVLVGAIVAVLVVPLFVGRRAYAISLVAMAGAVAALLTTGWSAVQVMNDAQAGLSPPGTPPILISDRFTVFFRLFLLMFLVLVIWLWLVGATRRVDPQALALQRGGAPAGPLDTTGIGCPEFFVLLLTSALGMLLMVSSLNLLVILIAMETASLPSYAMVASERRARLGAEAALKYVVFGAASAAIMVFGVSLLYGRFGTLDVGVMAAQLAAVRPTPGLYGDALLWLGLLGVGAGLCFKIAAVPMHLWCPDVFEGAPIEVTTWLSVASKAAGLGLLTRLVSVLAAAGGDAVPQALAWSVGLIAAVTCTVGNLAALRQDSVKRILAYSSIAHAGYMLMAAALVIGQPAGVTNTGLGALVAYFSVYVVMNLGAFGATALVVWHTGSDHVAAFTALGRRAPWIALPLAICLFSLVGLPPLGGFAAKWYLLLALGRSAFTQPWLWTLVIVAAVNTAISLYFYVRIIRQMYLVEDPQLPAFRAPWGGLALVNASAVVLILLGTLWFNTLGRRAEAFASQIFAPTTATLANAPAATAHP